MLKNILKTLILLFPASIYAKNLVVGVENIKYKPQYYMEKGQYSGYGRDLLDEFAKHSGHTITYKALPVSRLFDAFINGDVDLKYPDNKYWRANDKKGIKVSYSNPAVKFIEGVLVLPENETKSAKFFEKISTVRGFTPFAILDLIKSGQISIIENNDFKSSMLMAINGRSQGVFGNVAVAMETLKSIKKPGTLVLNKNIPFTSDHYYLASIKHPDVIDEFNKFLKEKNSLIAELKMKHQVEEGVN